MEKNKPIFCKKEKGKKMKKTVYIGIYVVILIVVIIICGMFFLKQEKEQDPILHNTELQNEEMEKQTNEIPHVTPENHLENTTVNETEKNEIEHTTSSETFEESPQTAEQKAIAIAKKDWGNDANIEFSVDGMDEKGNYIVAVRNSETTQALAFYTINVTTQTFNKKELN